MIYHCACGICVPFWLHSFRSVSYLDRTNTSFHFHYKHTPQHRTASGKYSFPFRRLYLFRFPISLFPRIFNGIFLFSAKRLPQMNQSPKGRAVSILHLIGALYRRTANTRIKPRKPLVFFIVGLFRVAFKKHKRFSEYGDRCQAPLQAACKLFSTSCNNHKNSPPPYSSCRKIKPFRVYSFKRLRYMRSIPASFVPVGFVPRPTNTSFLLHYKHTPKHHTASGRYLFPFYKLHSFRFPPSSFPTHFQWFILFSAASLPHWIQSPKGRVESIFT